MSDMPRSDQMESIVTRIHSLRAILLVVRGEMTNIPEMMGFPKPTATTDFSQEHVITDAINTLIRYYTGQETVFTALMERFASEEGEPT